MTQAAAMPLQQLRCATACRALMQTSQNLPQPQPGPSKCLVCDLFLLRCHSSHASCAGSTSRGLQALYQCSCFASTGLRYLLCHWPERNLPHLATDTHAAVIGAQLGYAGATPLHWLLLRFTMGSSSSSSSLASLLDGLLGRLVLCGQPCHCLLGPPAAHGRALQGAQGASSGGP
jgi:hypothetical protein